jgi:hypothetical protein
MRALAGQKGKKKKKKKGGKKRAQFKKKQKKIHLPGGKQIYDMTDYDILKTLINDQICKYMPPSRLTEFIGEFNYIHSMLDTIADAPFDPSMALIRQLVTEFVIFPLGSELIRKRHPNHVRSILFYGPNGTGKTMMVRAIATETKAICFDISPVQTQNIYHAKNSDKMIAMVMKCAKAYQPAVIYIDECERVWPNKKKGGKRKTKK